MPNAMNSGVIAAPIMPFNDDASVDWRTFDHYIGEVAAGGAAGVAMNMAASEGGSLELSEQLEVVVRSKRAVGGQCPIISGVIATHTAGAIAKTKRLVDAGADGIVIFPPLPIFSSKPLPVSMVIDYHRAIAEVAGVPIIAFQTSNVAYPNGAIAALADIPNVAAVKDAAFDIERTAEILEEVQGASRTIGVLTGNDTFILEALLLGCSGALIGFAGTATAELVKMQRLASRGAATEAYEIWRQLGPLARFIWSSPLRDFRARMKYVLHRQGVIPSAFTRAPQTMATAQDRSKLDRIFERYKLDDPKYLPSGSRLA